MHEGVTRELGGLRPEHLGGGSQPRADSVILDNTFDSILRALEDVAIHFVGNTLLHKQRLLLVLLFFMIFVYYREELALVSWLVNFNRNTSSVSSTNILLVLSLVDGL